MKYVIAVFIPPSYTREIKTAFKFSQEVLSQKHQINQIFFYQAGVLNAIRYKNIAIPAWEKLNTPLAVCRSACDFYKINNIDIKPGFNFSTLTQFFAEIFKADRYVVFKK